MVFWALSLSDRTWSVHSRIIELGPFHAGISWLHKLGTGRERWSVPPQWAIVMKHKQQKVSGRPVPRNLRLVLQSFLDLMGEGLREREWWYTPWAAEDA